MTVYVIVIGLHEVFRWFLPSFDRGSVISPRRGPSLPHSGRPAPLVTTHDAFQYYARAYGLEIFGTLIGISTEEQPSAQTVRKLADAIQTANVPAIFAETTINPALIQTVAAEAGVKLAERELYSDSLGAAGSDANSYIEMIVANTQTIVESLGGNYTPFALTNTTQP